MCNLRNASSFHALTWLQYAQRAYLINEFTDGRWQNKPFPGTGQFVGYTLGNGLLGQYGFPSKHVPGKLVLSLSACKLIVALLRLSPGPSFHLLDSIFCPLHATL